MPSGGATYVTYEEFLETSHEDNILYNFMDKVNKVINSKDDFVNTIVTAEITDGASVNFLPVNFCVVNENNSPDASITSGFVLEYVSPNVSQYMEYTSFRTLTLHLYRNESGELMVYTNISDANAGMVLNFIDSDSSWEVGTMSAIEYINTKEFTLYARGELSQRAVNESSDNS